VIIAQPPEVTRSVVGCTYSSVFIDAPHRSQVPVKTRPVVTMDSSSVSKVGVTETSPLTIYEMRLDSSVVTELAKV
jgi:hypothetical protein